MGFEGERVGDGMWDEEDKASNDNKKKRKNICILIWNEREGNFSYHDFFFVFVAFLLPLLSS